MPKPHTSFIPPPGRTPLHQLLSLLQPALPADTPLYLVGGAVRDHLLRRPIHDLDFVLKEDSIRAARAAADALGGKFYKLDEARGTGRVLLERPDGSRLVLDFAAMRGATLEEDQRARDFTANSLAIDAHDPAQVFDPLGGALDIKEKRLRPCSDRSFQDDPLRTLRAVRFAAGLGFRMTAETRSQLRAAAPLLTRISAERQRDELFKILGGRRPAAAIRALDILGLLPQVFPELGAQKGVGQSPPHVYDVWEHTLSVVHHLDGLLAVLAAREHDEEAAGNITMGLAVMRLGRYRAHLRRHLGTELVPGRPWRGHLFLAALYHDAGKPAARSLDGDGRIRFLKHEFESARLLERRAGALQFSKEEIRRMTAVAGGHMRPHFLAGGAEPPSRRAIYRFFRGTKIAGVDICLLGLADLMGTCEQTLSQDLWRRYLDLTRELLENWWEKPAESVQPPPLLDGNDLIRRFELSPGPQIGELLDRVREAQASGEVGDREQAYRFLSALLKEREFGVRKKRPANGG